jgi:hypothetical protein
LCALGSTFQGLPKPTFQRPFQSQYSRNVGRLSSYASTPYPTHRKTPAKVVPYIDSQIAFPSSLTTKQNLALCFGTRPSSWAISKFWSVRISNQLKKTKNLWTVCKEVKGPPLAIVLKLFLHILESEAPHSPPWNIHNFRILACPAVLSSLLYVMWKIIHVVPAQYCCQPPARPLLFCTTSGPVAYQLVFALSTHILCPSVCLCVLSLPASLSPSSLRLSSLCLSSSYLPSILVVAKLSFSNAKISNRAIRANSKLLYALY